MATPTQALSKHFSDSWTYTAIAWSSFNVYFDAGAVRTGYTDNDLWVEPSIELLSVSGQMNNPEAFAINLEQYLFKIEIVGKRDIGMSAFTDRTANLVTLYNRASITSESVKLYFRECEVHDGFVRNDDYWTVPVLVTFDAAV